MAAALEQHYLIMKVNYGDENRNEEFLKAYPKVPAYPHFFVLDGDGTFLHSQGTAELEEGRGYNEDVFLAFLEKWQPETPPEPTAEASADIELPDAEDVLAEGIERAGAEGKKVLVHLSAPT